MTDDMNSNMYGYNDYQGPSSYFAPTSNLTNNLQEESSDEEDDHNPLIAGMWMEGDSLAPPCGASIPSIHSILSLAQITSSDVLYDLGCGDGRICLEAFFASSTTNQSYSKCHSCVGVEIEQDLVLRFQSLIQKSFLYEHQRKIPNIKSRSIQAKQKDLCTILNKLVQLYAQPNSTNNQQDTDSTENLPRPTVITLYLLPESIALIQPQLIALMQHNKDLRIVCNTWGLKGLLPTKSTEYMEQNESATISLYTHDSIRDLS